MTNNIQRVSQLLAENKIDWVVLSGADAVCFATGHVAQIEIGLSPFAGGPTLALISAEGAAGVVAPNIEGQQLMDLPYEIYEGFAFTVTDQLSNFRSAAQKLIKKLGVSGRIAFETISFPSSLKDILVGDFVPFDTPLARLRAVKSDHEITLLRTAAKVAAVGQMAARKHSLAGRGELEVLNLTRGAMEMAAGERCALAGEYLASVERTSVLGTPPGSYVLKDGDPILVDLAPRVQGYWGDSCNAFIVGGNATPEYQEVFEASKSTLELAMAELRPGLRVCDFDKQLRDHMHGLGFSYPHHSGHGIGASVHEFPRLLPDETAMIEEDMVLMVEPGAYIPGIGGIRCEFMLHVTSTGCENMAPFTMNTDPLK